MWKIVEGRFQNNQNRPILSRIVNTTAFRRSLLVLGSLLFLNSTSPAATVNVGLVQVRKSQKEQRCLLYPTKQQRTIFLLPFVGQIRQPP
jgi:hypothetical protein